MAATQTAQVASGQTQNDIENDSKRIDRLLCSAKEGNWDQVWTILGSPGSYSTRLINSIPENRRWGVIHQAIFWKNPDILNKLLSYPECDSHMGTKKCNDESSQTATQVAEKYKYKDMSNILEKHDNRIMKQNIPTFLPIQNYFESKSMGLITVTLAAYKKTFHPKPIDPQKTITSVLRDIFSDINTSNTRWKDVMEKVSDCVYIVSEEHYNKILGSKSIQMFYQNVINTYTEEKNNLYTHLNMAFRGQRSDHYTPTGNDLALGPYAVIYQMLLLFWEDLPRETGTTYRKMLLSKADADKYQRGIIFVWQSIVSSSTELCCAVPFPTCGPVGDQSAIFTIDNSAKSEWQPRNIEKYARYVEHERTYPAGAKFFVKERVIKNGEVHVTLKLLS